MPTLAHSAWRSGPILISAKINGGVISSSNTYFFTYIINDLEKLSTVSLLTSLGIIPGILLADPIISKFGKKACHVFAILISVPFMLLRLFAIENFSVILLASVISGISSGIAIPIHYGMQADNTDYIILIAKAVPDFFTAMIFACQLGKATAFIGIPQGAVLQTPFALAKVIVPLTAKTTIADFKACGGFILVATGLRMMKVKAFPIADMIPAMVLVMPVSYAWSAWLLPMIG